MRTTITPVTRSMNQRATRDRLPKRTNADLPANEALPDGVGGTITGGPTEPINVMEILARGPRGAAGAVSGAAHVVVCGLGRSRGQDHGIALSDGSRISFATIADSGVLTDDEDRDRVHENTGAPARRESRLPTDRYCRVLTTA